MLWHDRLCNLVQNMDNLVNIMQKPKLQLKNQNWPEVELGEILEYEQPTKYIVHSTNYKVEYPTPVLTAGKSFILGNTNEKTGIFSKDKLPVIIFDDFTTASKFVDFPFKVKSSAMKILHPKKDLVDTKFIFYKMQTIDFPATQHKRYWISKYSKIKIPLPPLAEQKRIVRKIEKIFQKIDETQRLRAESLSASSALLPSAMHQIFSRAGKKEWQEWELGDIAETKMGGTPRTYIREFWNDGNIVWITPEDLQKDEINNIFDSRRKISQIALIKGKVKMFPKDTVFVSTTATIGKVGIAKVEMSANQQITGIVCSEKVIPRFLAYYFLHFGEENLRAIGGTAVATHINQANFRKIKVSLPPLAEQKKIVAYLDSLSAKARELQNLQQQTAADFSALRQSILVKAFAGRL